MNYDLIQRVVPPILVQMSDIVDVWQFEAIIKAIHEIVKQPDKSECEYLLHFVRWCLYRHATVIFNFNFAFRAHLRKILATLGLYFF